MAFRQVRFVRESGVAVAAKAQKRERQRRLDGEEVKQFYQSVVSESDQKKTSAVGEASRTVRTVKTNASQSRRSQLSKSDCLLPKKIDIFKCCQNGQFKEVKEWISSGQAIDSKDFFGWTPLMCASCAGHAEIVELLLKNGADFRVTDRRGLNALELATRNNHFQVIQVLISFSKSNTSKKSKVSDNKVNEMPNSKDERGTKRRTCDLCHQRYFGSYRHHQCSIVHQVNSEGAGSQTFYSISQKNRGYQLMLKSGWNRDKGLGPCGDGQKYPVKTVLKRNRLGLGIDDKAPARVSHFAPFDSRAVSECSKRDDAKKQRTKLLRDEYRKRKIEIEFRRQFR